MLCCGSRGSKRSVSAVLCMHVPVSNAFIQKTDSRKIEKSTFYPNLKHERLRLWPRNPHPALVALCNGY